MEEMGKPRRRWFQFTLRTMLIAVLVVCSEDERGEKLPTPLIEVALSGE